MRERENEIFGEAVQHAKGELVVMVFAMDGIKSEVLQGVVHPSHIPFQAEAQAAEIDRPRNHGPRRRLFRDGLNAGIFLVNFLIQLAQEIDGFEILASAVFVGKPLALFARVVAGKAWTPQHPRAGRPRDTYPARTLHSTAGSFGLRCVRS